MDPFSISIGCITLLDLVTKTSKQLSELSKRYCEAPSELSRVSTQLQDLTHLLELISHDEYKQCTDFEDPNSKNDLIMDQVNVCMDIVEELQTLISEINDSRLTWAITGKSAVENICNKLQMETAQLEFILGVHTLAIVKNLKVDTSELLIYSEQIGSQIQRLSEHMGLMDNSGPKNIRTLQFSPSCSKTSQGVCIETTAQSDVPPGGIPDAVEPTVIEDSYTNGSSSPTSSFHWSGSTVYSPPSSVRTPTIDDEEAAHFVTPPYDHPPITAMTWSDYHHSAAAHTTLWDGQVQDTPTVMVPDPGKAYNEITVEHIEAPTTPSIEETIRNQFKQATWSLALKGKDTRKQKVNSIAESFKEMVKAASVKAACITG
ncbi:hypothetical protein QBC40DRAFT_278959 [Triangularia verruculosa]|uniref:Fungal N-terminal domain-containing protein n=1 Tax=Triangularia verruculosa TaxID=2587418 RepID=A0AAN6XNH8_9PEZI|nr:hypothetical protein QBC40DRAFT_278959 [Triangularia verruculosa]